VTVAPNSPLQLFWINDGQPRHATFVALALGELL
jgi:hypothetical protein